METLLASLMSSFSPSEVKSQKGVSACSRVLETLGRAGYKQPITLTPLSYQMLADAVSAFASSTVMPESARRLSSTIKPRLVSPWLSLAVSANYLENLSQTMISYRQFYLIAFKYMDCVYFVQMKGLVTGVGSGMAEGEAPVTIITKYMQLNVQSALISDTGNSVLTAPLTAAQKASGSLQPTITFGPAGLSACAFAGSYAQLSIAEWVVNPFRNSGTIQSSLLRFSSLSQDIAPAGAMQSNRSTSLSTNQPAYTISLQFHEIQDFNFSAAAAFDKEGKVTQNFTLPACTLYDGAQYVACKGCNISSYTNYNVTYSCYDINQLCPPQTKVKRYLEDSQEEEYEEEEVDEEEEILEEDETEHDRSLASESNRSRFLQANDDESSTGRTSSKTFGVLFQTIARQIPAVVSSNPFATDPKQSIIVLTLVGCLVGSIFLMLIYLRRLDYRENLRNTYVKRMRNAAARKMLEDDIKKGGRGDFENMYREHMDEFHGKGTKCRRISRCIRCPPICRCLFAPKLTAFELQSNYDSDSMDSMGHYSDYSASVQSSEEGSTNMSPQMSDRSMSPAASIHSSTAEATTDEEEYHSLEERQNAMTAIVTEFLHKLFPGHSIFSKDMSALRVIFANHIYFKMLAGSSLKVSRSIRFLELVVLVLVSFFVDTVFFGAFYPAKNPCGSFTDKVRLLKISLCVATDCIITSLMTAMESISLSSFFHSAALVYRCAI